MEEPPEYIHPNNGMANYQWTVRSSNFFRAIIKFGPAG